MIKFLVDSYGADKFAELLKTFKDGSTPDKAFQAVYGFDQLGYENAWRQSVGLEPRTASASATPQATGEARTAPTSSAKATPAASTRSTSGDDGTPVVTIAIIIALAAALLAAVVGAGMVVMRRM
jgi:hypothetical protein